MKKILEYLEKLGFSSLEAKLYLSLLSSGPMTVQELAKAAKINRTAAYSYVSSLIEKGIFLEQWKGSRKQLAAIAPERLHYLLDNKLRGLRALGLSKDVTVAF